MTWNETSDLAIQARASEASYVKRRKAGSRLLIGGAIALLLSYNRYNCLSFLYNDWDREGLRHAWSIRYVKRSVFVFRWIYLLKWLRSLVSYMLKLSVTHDLGVGLGLGLGLEEKWNVWARSMPFISTGLHRFILILKLMLSNFAQLSIQGVVNLMLIVWFFHPCTISSRSGRLSGRDHSLN